VKAALLHEGGGGGRLLLEQLLLRRVEGGEGLTHHPQQARLEVLQQQRVAGN
jgi:hypothetical protein